MIRKILFSFLVLASFVVTKAQSVPYNWTFTAKKVAQGTYEVHCKASVEAPWHTYSQFTPAGGPVPTKFVFTKNPLYKTDGEVKELGTMITRHEEVFGVDVKYFKGDVDFVQVIKIKSTAKTNFTGTVTFMVCNDTECLPPKTQNFSVPLN